MTGKILKGKTGNWSHPSVLALMNDASQGEEPRDVIQRKARALVNEALDLGWEGPPFDPKVLASFRGIDVVEAGEPIGSEARIFPTPSGTVRIEFDSSYPATRVNFSICHELAHTFFPDCYEVARNRNSSSPEQRKHQELEALCDFGAAELLMPARIFERDARAETINLERIVTLAGRYHASTEATMLRVAQFSGESFALAVMSEKFKPSEEREARTRSLGFSGMEPRQKLRIDYARATNGFHLFIPKDKSAPPNSVAYKALVEGGVHTACESWDIPGFGMRRVQAVELPKVNSVSRCAVLFVNSAHAE